MNEVFRTFAAWFFIWAAFIVAVAIGFAALGVLVLAVPVMVLIRRAFTSKSASRQAGSGTVVEGEYRVVDTRP
jgi:hypothetical protein